MDTLDVGGIGINTFQSVLDGCEKITLSPYTELEFKLAESLKRANKEFEEVNIVKDDAEKLASFDDESFDQILVIDVLEHVTNLDRALEQIYRVLRKNGIVIISVPTHYYPTFFGQKFDMEIGHLRHFSTTELSKIMLDYGFTIEIIKPYTYYYTSILCNIFYDKLYNSKIKFLLMPVLNYLSLFTEKVPTKLYTEVLGIFKKK
ncbi:MAG: class I SAM-dependent methyltransferase [Candidatus Parvarchaeota archaeon]